MAIYSYRAIEASSGRECTGTLEGATAETASGALKARGLAPLAVAEITQHQQTSSRRTKRASSGPSPSSATARAHLSGVRQSLRFGRAISTKELALFTRQLATLVGSGIPLVRSLAALSRQESNPYFRQVIEGLAESIRSGDTLSQALGRHPRVFDRLYVSMVRAGEASGALGDTLNRLSRFLERSLRVRGKISAAMMYPSAVILLAGGIVAGLMVFVVPKFEQIFAEMLKGQPLPVLTRTVIAASQWVQHHALASALLLGVVATVFVAFRRTGRGSWLTDRALLALPVVGDLLLKAAVARFTRTLGTLLGSGVSILDALVITRDASGNACVARALDVAHERVTAGETLAAPLEAARLLPATVLSMIEVGEQTGALAPMLTRIADGFDDEVDLSVEGLTALIEPVMIAALALSIGTLVIALFLPIVSIIQHML